MIVLGLDGKTHLRKAALTGRVQARAAPSLCKVPVRIFLCSFAEVTAAGDVNHKACFGLLTADAAGLFSTPARLEGCHVR